MKVMACRSFGGVKYARHTFEKAGDEFHVHQHTPQQAEAIHTTIVARGSLRLLGKRDGLVVRAGDFLIWEIDEPHGLVAMEDGSVVFNIRMELPNDRPCPNIIEQPSG